MDRNTEGVLLMNQCPLNEDYKFNGACRIGTCKYHTNTKNKCMGIDTVFAATDRGVTQAEIASLKLQGLSKKEVAKRIKISQETVKAALHLYSAFSEDAKVNRTAFEMLLYSMDLFCAKIIPTTPVLYRILTSDFARLIGLDTTNVHKLLDVKGANLHLPFKLTEREFEQLLSYLGETHEHY